MKRDGILLDVFIYNSIKWQKAAKGGRSGRRKRTRKLPKNLK
jgi:hypothetical protein